MRDILAGLCDARTHKSLGCADALGLREQRGQHSELRFGKAEGPDLLLEHGRHLAPHMHEQPA